jgi:hypothetical protein
MSLEASSTSEVIRLDRVAGVTDIRQPNVQSCCNVLAQSTDGTSDARLAGRSAVPVRSCGSGADRTAAMTDMRCSACSLCVVLSAAEVLIITHTEKAKRNDERVDRPYSTRYSTDARVPSRGLSE